MQHPATSSNVIAVALVSVAVSADLCRAQDVRNLLLNPGAEQGMNDQPSVWFAAQVPAEGLRMWRATDTFHNGSASLVIANERDYQRETSNNWAQNLQQVPQGARLCVGAWIKTEKAEAVNVCLQCWDEKNETLLAFATTPVVRGDQDWTFLQSNPVVVPSKTATITVRAALTGKGKAWFDDLLVTQLSSLVTGPGEDKLREAVDGRIVRAIPVVKDCMILSYMPDWDHGNLDNIAVANNDGGVRTLAAWNWAAVSPAEASDPDLRFVLALYSRRTTSHEPAGGILVNEIQEPWKERTSWKRRPRVDDKPVASVDFSPGKGWKLFDLTPLVRRQYDRKQELCGVVLRFADEDRTADAPIRQPGSAAEKRGEWSGYAFVSREGDGEWSGCRPRLLVLASGQKTSTQPARATTTREMLDQLEWLASLKSVQIESVPGSGDGYHEATNKASSAGSLEAGIPIYEQFVQRFPLTPEGIQMMNLLGTVYPRVGRFDEGRRILQIALALAKNDPFAGIIEIDLAHVDTEAGQLDAAEARLRRLMAKPMPASFNDWQEVTPQILAYQFLAKVCQKRGNRDEADKTLRQMAEMVSKMMQAHPNADFLPSYLVAAYQDRVSLLLEVRPPDLVGARRLVNELQAHLPNGYRDVDGPRSILQSIERIESGLTSSTTAAAPSGPRDR